MSRIRSIHPGLWTDEEFVSLSPFARLFFMGLWNECDDGGVFVWSPLKLKMRLLPADNVDASALLDEVTAAGCIMRYEIGGKAYGAVRNFCKFQRPKKPTYPNPMTSEVRNFVSLNAAESESGSEAVPHQFPTAGEIAPQMEDGGDNRREEKKEGYAFRAKIVRLNRADYDGWRARFHAIADFDAELSTLDTWLSDQPATKQARWFATGSSWLNRRHQEALAATSPARKVEFSGPC